MIVIGSAIPEEPEIIEAVNETSTSVTVSWRVESVSYTPETYMVLYGISDSDQVESSRVVFGPTQLHEILSINGAEYRVTLTDLKPYTGYYYYVNATNTEGSSISAVEYFQTNEDGMLPLVHQYCHSYNVILVPEKVQHLLVDFLNSITSVTVQWSEPAVPNGVITSYEVNVSIAELNAIVDIIYMEDLELETNVTVDIGNFIVSVNCIYTTIIHRTIHTIHGISSRIY